MSKNTAIILIVAAFIPSLTLYGRSDLLRECIDTLSSRSMEGRGRINSSLGAYPISKRGHDAAAEYIASRFSESGLVPFSENFLSSFPMSDGHGDGINIMGLFPGMESFPVGGYVIVGAHYDNLGTINGTMYPGADSNASGVAALLSLCEHFHLLRYLNRYFNTSIIFVAFDCYMDGRSGAAYLWNRICSGSLTDPKTGAAITSDKVRLMIDLDQLGSSRYPVHKDRVDYLISLGVQSLPSYRRNVISRANSSYGIDVVYSYYSSEKFTDVFYRLGDRGVFVQAGVPTLYFTSGITDVTNTVHDTADLIDFPILEKRIRLIAGVLEGCL